MKKIFAILLGLSVLGIVAAGCSGGDAAAGETTGDAGAAAPKEGE
ncbi:MAG TPA: hypothetical protein PKA27_15225 [Fimbriimonadaceae bacterium]|nr:hypothetical protein [Fimbriimonadaceae bacterium]